jgi:hypothetical protein
MYFHGPIVEMDNGDLLASMYGGFKGDQRRRCILMKSTDSGHSWRYFSTITHNPLATPFFGEPAVIRTGPSSLFTTMRISNAIPMYQCTSSDGGRTWTTPRPNGAASVDPQLAMTDDGILVCSYGRPGVYVMFSADGKGETWSGHTMIYQGPTTGYTALAKTGPNTVLLAHDATGNTIRVVPITVHRAKQP